jgi:hypothetical protein
MKVLFMISHPAHFHMFRNTIGNLQEDGHKVTVIIRPKDVLESLCQNASMPYLKVKSRPQRCGRIGLGLSLLGKTWETWRIAAKERPDMLVSSDGAFAIVGRLIGKPSFECNEDDAEAISLYARLFFPLSTGLILPDCCSAGKWAYKKIGYKSYHELGYLHPNQFTPDRTKVEQYGIDTTRPYILVRFAQLTAHHDVGIHGINSEIAGKMMEMLLPHGTVYITSERPLEPQFEQYRIKIDPLDMHHVMAFASLYIGDSQTMAAEAGVLGTPFVRFNDFVGRLSYLNELENDYHLGFGHKTHDVEGFYASIQRWLDTPDRKSICAERRERMLADKIDYTKFLTWFLENYPASRETMDQDPNYQLRFK